MAISPQWLIITWVETSGVKGKVVLLWVRLAWALPCVQPDLNLLRGPRCWGWMQDGTCC